jgi:hypothetical protein
MRFHSAAISLFLLVVGTSSTAVVSAFSPSSSSSSSSSSAFVVHRHHKHRVSASASLPKLWSTLAPESQTFTEGFDDTNDNDENASNNKKSATSITAKEKNKIKPIPTKIDKKSFYPLQQENNGDTVSSSSSSSSSGPLSMDMNTLAQHMGGHGRAKLVWDCYKVGIDPSNLHGDVMNLGPSWEDYETIMGLLPSKRRSQRLSQSSLNILEDLVAVGSQQPQQSQSQPQQQARQIENGVATLSYISRSGDGTTKLLLKMVDGLQVECVIIPWKNQRSTLCISSQVGCRQGCTFCASKYSSRVESSQVTTVESSNDPSCLHSMFLVLLFSSITLFCFVSFHSYYMFIVLITAGRMGKLRNLSSDEILAQMFFAVKMCRLEGLPEISNIV